MKVSPELRRNRLKLGEALGHSKTLRRLFYNPRQIFAGALSFAPRREAVQGAGRKRFE